MLIAYLLGQMLTERREKIMGIAWNSANGLIDTQYDGNYMKWKSTLSSKRHRYARHAKSKKRLENKKLNHSTNWAALSREGKFVIQRNSFAWVRFNLTFPLCYFFPRDMVVHSADALILG